MTDQQNSPIIPEDVTESVRETMQGYGNAASDGRQWNIYLAMRFAETAVLADRSRRAEAPAEATDRDRTVRFCAELAWDSAFALLIDGGHSELIADEVASGVRENILANTNTQPELAPDVKGLVERLKAHLHEHWLASVVCDHDAKTDTATCSCSQWRDEPHPSIGAAVDAWIDHVFATIDPPLSRLSAPPAKAPDAYLNEQGVAYLPVRFPVQHRLHPAEHGLTPLYKHPAPPAEAPIPPGIDPELVAYTQRLRHACALSGYHEHDGCSCSNVDLNEAYVSGRLKLPTRVGPDEPAPAEAKPVAWRVFDREHPDFGWLLKEERPMTGKELGLNDEDALQLDDRVVVEALGIILHPDPRAKAAEAVPEGMVLLPREPTREMILAAESELENQTDSDYDSDTEGNRYSYSIRRPGWELHVYRAMLAAAPQPLSTGEVK